MFTFCSEQCFVSVFKCALSPFKQAAYHQEVGEELRVRALQYGSECTSGYINLLEQVLQVRMSHKHVA